MTQLESSSMNMLLQELRSLIDETRATVAAAVNVSLTMLYWRIGKRINENILREERAAYGERLIAELSQRLAAEYGQGFSSANLRRMIQFASVYPDEQIVVSVIRQLSWTHFLALLPLKDALQREFYAQMCRIEGWSVRTLREKIDSMLFERTALSRKPENLIRQELAMLRTEDRLTPDLVFHDPYLLDFLGLHDHYLEKDLEDAILREIEAFLLEFGAGFAFIARQKRITVDDDDYYIDLLLFHRSLRRLVAVELKLGDFKPSHKGQMELYLRWLAKHELQPGEALPIGLILCAGKKQETIELLELEQSYIRVAEYWLELPPKEALARKLHAAIQSARARLGQPDTEDENSMGNSHS